MNTQKTLKTAMVAAGALLASISGAVWAAPVAVVTDVQGRAMLPKGGFVRELPVLAEVEGDARVEIDAKSKLVVVYYSSGSEFTFRGPAVVHFKAAGPESISGNAPERRAVALATSGNDRLKPGGLTRAAYMMMGVNSNLTLLGLSDTRTLEARPEFSWSELEAGQTYQFRLMGDAGRVVYETSTTATSLKLPANVSLEPDAKYTWRVAARRSDGSQASATGDFRIGPADLRAQIEKARPDDSAELSQKIAFALWLEQLEFRDEARKYWALARAQWPNDSRLESLAGR